jgi:DNA-binding CsgD family transcriptional regulator
LDIFLLAVIITLSLVFRKYNFIPLLLNGILSLYITVPLWGYHLFDVNKKYFKNIPILVITEAVIDNILLAYNILHFLFISRIVFYILLTVPIFIKNKTEIKTSELEMQKAAKITVTLFVLFMASLIPFTPLIFEVTYVSSLFWAVFTLSYQVPGLAYCKKYLFGKTVTKRLNGLSSLTKRENEVASAICNGLKYEEIAENMHISLSTVKKHSFNLYRKLGINNNRELMQIIMETSKSGNETEK